ncbi:MAG: MBL fold metallo-hydrolase [Desulfurococcales archaeon]|nr:MBL fold metallo-hydrolase [Desulfurococcales archaeon]
MKSWKGGIREIDDGIYAYIDPEGTWFKNNVGIIVGDVYTILVDTQYNEPRMRKLLDELTKINISKIRLIINTHHHGDHVWANHIVEDSITLSHKRAKDIIETLLTIDPGIYKALFPDLDFTGSKYTIPHVAFNGEEIELNPPGAPRIKLMYFGPAHTPGDVIVYLQDYKILFAGDIVFYRVTPLALDGYITGWIDRLEAIEDMDVDVVIPGHGPPTTTKGVRELKEYLLLVMKEAERLQNIDDPLEIALRINLGKFSEWRDPERIVPNIERALMEIRGEEPAKPLPDPMSTAMKMLKYKSLIEGRT